ncbi:MAG: ATP-binding cassette domain-containing protein [Succinivibrionaceae bacterium]|nr:ATP-binding cassette domain-containing protein [Succinivibrionaceae bacterium]
MSKKKKKEKLLELENLDTDAGFVVGYSKMWPFIRKYIWFAVLGVILTVPVGTLDALIALFLKPFMDNVMVEKQQDFAANVPLIIVGFVLIQGIFIYTSTLVNTYVGSKINLDIQKRMFDKLMDQDCRFYDANDSGAVIFRFYKDAETATSGLIDNFKLFLTKFFSSVSLVLVLIYNSWQLSFAAIGILLFLILPLKIVRKRIKAIMNKTVAESAFILTIYNETAAGNRIIRSYTLEESTRERFYNSARYLFGMGMKMVRDTNWLSPMMHVVSAVGVAVVIWYGGYLIVSQQITSGTFVSFIAALIMLYTPLKSIGNNYIKVQQAVLAICRIYEMLDMKTATEENRRLEEEGQLQELAGLDSDIEFRNVSFSYDGSRNVLENISFKVGKGEKLALVGNSGGGKTTVCSLIPRLYDIAGGEILIDGVDIRKFTLKSLRSQIAVVFQDNFLFTGTIRDNIMMGNPDATEEEVRLACSSACLDEFLASRPEGLNTQIGERGIQLSGGQKQRIAIARAFLKNAPIVILDEATSALDNKSEKVVQEALNNLMKNKTVLVIAHRLSTIIDSDSIMVINDGRIAERGTHDELIKKGGAYELLYRSQFKGS